MIFCSKFLLSMNFGCCINFINCKCNPQLWNWDIVVKINDGADILTIARKPNYLRILIKQKPFLWLFYEWCCLLASNKIEGRQRGLFLQTEQITSVWRFFELLSETFFKTFCQKAIILPTHCMTQFVTKNGAMILRNLKQ